MKENIPLELRDTLTGMVHTLSPKKPYPQNNHIFVVYSSGVFHRVALEPGRSWV